MELKMSFSLHFSGNLEISIYVTFFNPCSVCGGATHRAYLVARARAWSWGLKPNFVTFLKITLRIAISVGNFVTLLKIILRTTGKLEVCMRTES